MKRRSLLLGCLALVALVAVPRLLAPKPGVTVENFRRLHRGMTKEEVDAILGGPGEVSGFINNMARTRDWHGDHCTVSIMSSSLATLDAASGEIRTDDGRLLLRLAPEPPSCWDQLRRVLPWGDDQPARYYPPSISRPGP
jgi:hypothetical protein